MERKLFLWLFAVVPLVLISIFVVALVAVPQNKIPQDAERYVDVSLVVKRSVNPHNELLLLPDDSPVGLKITFSDTLQEQGFQFLMADTQWEASAGEISDASTWTARWIPPALSTTAKITACIKLIYRQSGLPGLLGKTFSILKDVSVRVISPTSVQYLHNGIIDGFKMGEYLRPDEDEKIKEFGNVPRWVKLYPEKYMPPEFFYKVTEENKDLYISRHYTLGDYSLDYPWYSLGYPQYIALDYNLIVKLKELQQLLEDNGIKTNKFKFIYGFRSPLFNLGTIMSAQEDTLKVPFSMHQYGRAADIIIDNNNDDIMDDL
ncbi:hypothetical protein J7M23_06025, partial [Candidatus Sumerlaeota bacterium]|nr:hypothetical protein [Candidatus Sumerlaeota bacterium]